MVSEANGIVKFYVLLEDPLDSYYKSYLRTNLGLGLIASPRPVHTAEEGRAGEATCTIAIIGAIKVVPNRPARRSGFTVIPGVRAR